MHEQQHTDMHVYTHLRVWRAEAAATPKNNARFSQLLRAASYTRSLRPHTPVAEGLIH
jgi:hypothetical protein